MGSVSQNNTFQSGGGEQSIAQGEKAIGTQINNYYAPPPQAAKPQPAPAVQTGPPTVIVDAMHRGDYVTITDALEAVKAGTRILVRPGLYREGIVIDKPVEIVGDGQRDDIIIEVADKHVILFQADRGRVANLTLRQIGSGIWHCINIANGMLNLEGCDISSKGRSCVAIHSGADPRLRRNRIHNSNEFGVFITKNGQGTLEHNEIFANAGAGVAIGEGDKPTLRCNRIFQNGHVGIWVYGGGSGVVEDNNLQGNDRGAWYIQAGCEVLVQRRGNIE